VTGAGEPLRRGIRCTGQFRRYRMTEQETAERIIAFAHHCDRADQPAETAARSRGWLDGDGWPTEDGRALVRALDEQAETRSVFRTVL